MFEVRQSPEYARWFDRLRDKNAKARIDVRVRRISLGNLGDAKFFGGIGELKINYGPGYRIYFVRRGELIIILLSGGDKSTQAADIDNAKAIAARWKD